MTGKLVLVSGASGYIGSRVVREFLDNGYRVRGTVRKLSKPQPHLQAMIDEGLPLELAEASLLDAESWTAACDGVDLVAHVASPFVLACKKSEAEAKLYAPARQGTLNVLRAAKAAGVQRVVVTSSVASIIGGHPPQRMFEKPEETWTDIDAKGVDPYFISKTIAERAAWDFVESEEGAGLELATVNPCLVIGPTLSPQDGESHGVIRRFLMRELPAIPDASQAVVDVRDVAKAHRLALETPGANGKRMVCVSGSMPFLQLSQVLKKAFRPYGYKPPTIKIPKWVLRIYAIIDSAAAVILPDVADGPRDFDTTVIRETLGMEFIPWQESVVAHAHSCLQVGVPGFRATRSYKKKVLQASDVAPGASSKGLGDEPAN